MARGFREIGRPSGPPFLHDHNRLRSHCALSAAGFQGKCALKKEYGMRQSAPSPEYELSEHDCHKVEALEAKLQIIRDRVRSVADRYQTACYLVGRHGTSKTFTVREELNALDVPWEYKNARMTPMGLFCFLQEHPEHVLVLDDIASLFTNEQALQILLAALGGEPGEPRVVSYRSKDRDLNFEFSGGVIAISNVALRHDPLVQAVGSRVTLLEHEPTDEEIAAFMRLLSMKGFLDLSATECLEVAEFVIYETRQHDHRLDLRHLTKGWQDFRQFKHGRARTPWQDLVRTSLHKLALEPLIPLSKKDEIALQRQLIVELVKKYPDDRPRQLAEWPHSQSLFYQRLRETRVPRPTTAAFPPGSPSRVPLPRCVETPESHSMFPEFQLSTSNTRTSV